MTIVSQSEWLHHDGGKRCYVSELWLLMIFSLMIKNTTLVMSPFFRSRAWLRSETSSWEEKRSIFDPALSHLQKKKRSVSNLDGDETSVKHARLLCGWRAITVEFSRWVPLQDPPWQKWQKSIVFPGIEGFRGWVLSSREQIWPDSLSFTHSYLWNCCTWDVQGWQAVLRLI